MFLILYRKYCSPIEILLTFQIRLWESSGFSLARERLKRRCRKSFELAAGCLYLSQNTTKDIASVPIMGDTRQTINKLFITICNNLILLIVLSPWGLVYIYFNVSFLKEKEKEKNFFYSLIVTFQLVFTNCYCYIFTRLFFIRNGQ